MHRYTIKALLKSKKANTERKNTNKEINQNKRKSIKRYRLLEIFYKKKTYRSSTSILTMLHWYKNEKQRIIKQSFNLTGY